MESLREVYDGCYRRLVGQLYALFVAVVEPQAVSTRSEKQASRRLNGRLGVPVAVETVETHE